MKILPFKPSQVASLGVEIEFQIIDPATYDLASKAKELLRDTSELPGACSLKPEVTQGMLEINSPVVLSAKDLEQEFFALQKYLVAQAKKFDVHFCGGGTHPFQRSSQQKIFPMQRFKRLTQQYRFLSKQGTVFGEHIHIGCSSPEDAIYLTHTLARYVPHFIALSAASPFNQGEDSGYYSCRSNLFNVFPSSGVMPFVNNWQEFSRYFYKMFDLGIVETMKDFYWDIRPKPEFGTVELRVCDTPLTFNDAILIANYAQTLAIYLLNVRPFEPSHDLYLLYNFNRFQAGRYGLDAEFFDPHNLQKIPLADDILKTIDILSAQHNLPGANSALEQIAANVIKRKCGASALREVYKQFGSLPEVVRYQCELWENH